ncbi:hypothetical protein OBBRIDRAFT_806713 [Obba rivulosa]|uniref:Uncharacterized protein n=1 Tax=Obba rivulosa TaxID=1052685 RepID=A0A8E2AL14_9APHY|nr:hypothetical protein OBBRIDRAFT_806713 [Obba rivulosa]
MPRFFRTLTWGETQFQAFSSRQPSGQKALFGLNFSGWEGQPLGGIIGGPHLSGKKNAKRDGKSHNITSHGSLHANLKVATNGFIRKNHSTSANGSSHSSSSSIWLHGRHFWIHTGHCHNMCWVLVTSTLYPNAHSSDQLTCINLRADDTPPYTLSPESRSKVVKSRSQKQGETSLLVLTATMSLYTQCSSGTPRTIANLALASTYAKRKPLSYYDSAATAENRPQIKSREYTIIAQHYAAPQTLLPGIRLYDSAWGLRDLRSTMSRYWNENRNISIG